MTVRVRQLHFSRSLLAALVVGLASSACASTTSDLEIGFKRVALDLAFKDPEKAVDPEPQVIIRKLIDAEIEVAAIDPGPRVVRRIIPRPPQIETFTCDVAPEGAVPQEPAFPVVRTPPVEGRYSRHNEGTISLELAIQPIDIPVPPNSDWDVTGVAEHPASPLVADRDAEAAGGVTDGLEDQERVFPASTDFQLTRRLTRGFVTTDTYRYTNTGETEGDYLHLIKRVTVANGEESVFEPSPPVRILRLNVPEGNIADSGVAHAGLDRTSNVAMSSVSQILGRESVDVCGQVVDTYRVQIQQQFVDLSKNPPEVSGNEGDAADFWNIQIDNGLLIVREQVNRTLRTSTQVAGQSVPVTVRYNYVSTLDRLDPSPIPEDEL